jgi:hypothetical protein
VKEIGDLVTIFELLKEDIDFYKGTISNIQDDRKGMEETMARAKQREEVCKVECKRKIEIQVE